MTEIINSNGIKTLVFAKTFEYEAYEQIKEMVNSEPYQNSKVRIMPDAHAGKGCTVGTTMTISDKVTPNLVGVDIGCGMLTVKLKDKTVDLPKLDNVINKYIPHGFNVHEKRKSNFNLSKLKCLTYVDNERANLSIGTLGGGNHFIELSTNKLGELFLIIHTGSRKLGGDVCKYYQNLAFKKIDICRKERVELINKLKLEGREKDIQQELLNLKSLKINKDLSYLEGSDFDNYMNDMNIVQQFAVENRKLIADIIIKKMGLDEDSRFETIHNYIDFKRMILRKGAVSAEAGEILLIPINMRDGSLLCVGKGNEDWNYSAPHGAGRLMSRSKAKENINLEEFSKSMEGIYSTSVSKSTLDEAPQAYKSMDEIIEAVNETVDIVDVLKPIYNFKSN